MPVKNRVFSRFVTGEKEIQRRHTLEVPDLCKRRLLGYAETFQELARSMRGGPQQVSGDRQAFLEARKQWENRQVIGSNLTQMAQIMIRVADEVFYYEPLEEKKKKQLIHILREEGILVEEACYIPQGEGRRAIGLTMYTEKKSRRPAGDVADMLSAVFDKPIQPSVTSPYYVEYHRHSFIFVEEPPYIVLTGSARAVKENEKISGDNYAIAESEKGRVTILLSDGTGSGEEACRGSGQVLDLMEKMLEAGYGTAEAVKLVNAALFAGGEEQNHPTLDVCDMNLYKGSCCFFKVGGAASFLKREDSVEQIGTGNLPLGVFQTIEPQEEYRKLKDGDFLVFLTDGVLDALGENNYEEAVCDALLEMTEQNPREIAEKLLQLAICKGGGRILDDMTVIVIGLWENSVLT